MKKRLDLGYFASKSGGKSAIIYNKTMLSESSISTIHDLERENEQLKNKVNMFESTAVLSEKDLQTMIDEQVKLFGKAGTDFDYQTLFESKRTCDTLDSPENYLLEKKYLHKPLVSLLERVLGFDKSKAISQAHLHKQCLKLQTAISVLCNIRNKESVMVQTILGLVAYASGLRDKGFKILIWLVGCFWA